MSKEATARSAMKLALEALKELVAQTDGSLFAVKHDHVALQNARQAITALQKALANEAIDKMAENARQVGLDYEPAQKPQRWAVFCQGCRKEWSVSYPHPGKDICVDCDDKPAQQEPVAKDSSNYRLDPPGLDQLYTSPPAQRTWVNATTWRGLTDEEKRQLFEREDYQGWLDYINAIEAKLRSKNEDRN